MSFLSGFAGAAAQSFSETSKEWKALFQEDDKLEEARRQHDLSHNLRKDEAAAEAERWRTEFDWKAELEDDRLDENRRQFDLSHQLQVDTVAAEAGRWQTEFDWRKEIEGLRQDLAEGTFQDTQLNGYFNNVIANLSEYSAEDQLEVYSTFTDTFGNTPVGQAYGNLIKARISSRDHITRDEALAGLNAILATPQGSIVFQPIVDNYLESLSPDEQDKYRPMFEAHQAGRAEDMEQFEATARELNTLSVDAEQARIAADQASANAQNTQAFVALGRHNIDVELHDRINMPMLQNALIVSDNEVQQSIIDTEYYPANAAANAREAIANADGAVAQAEVARMTVEATIDTVVARGRITAAEAGLAEEDLRFNLATAGAREAILSYEADAKEATVLQIEAYINVLKEQVTDSQFMRSQASLEIVQSLVQSGSTELLDRLGEDVLRMAFGDDWESVQTEIMERATSQRSILDQRVEVAMIFEEHEADLMRQEADTYAERLQDSRDAQAFNEEIARERLRLEEIGVVINQDYLQLARESQAFDMAHKSRLHEAGLVTAAQGAPRHEIFETVVGITKITQKDLAAYAAEATGLSLVQSELTRLAEVYSENPQAAQGVLEGITPLLNDFGIDTELLSDADSVVAAAQFVGNQLRASRDHFIRAGGIFWSSATGLGATVLPEDFSLNTSIDIDRQLWNAILRQSGSVRGHFAELDDAEREVAPAMSSVLSNFVPSMIVNGTAVITPATLTSVYNTLLESTSVEQLEAININGPQDMTERVREAATEYQTIRDSVETYAPLYETWGINIDPNNPQVVNVAAATVEEKVGRAIQLRDGVGTLQSPGSTTQFNLFAPGSLFNQDGMTADERQVIFDTHSAYIRDIEDVYGLPFQVLVQEGFASDNNRNPIITNPLGLAQYLQTLSSEWGNAAQALSDLNRY